MWPPRRTTSIDRMRLRIRSRIISGLAVAAVLVATGVVGTGSAEALDRPAATVTPGSCVLDFPAEARCGQLDVPEDYDRPSGRRLRLPYVIFPATQRPALPDPILLIGGGPGGSTVAAARAFLDFGRPVSYDPRRDTIFLEVRGAGYAEPSLACSALVFDPAMLAFPRHEVDDVRACHAELVGRGFDLNQYRTGVTARDIAEARRAFGFGQWNLYSASYGTTLASVVMTADPTGIRSVMLDAVSPPQLDIAIRDVTNTLDQVSHYDRVCAADATCRGHLPDLRGAVESAILRLQQHPLPTVAGPMDGVTYIFTLSALMQGGAIEVTPAFIAAVAASDTATVNAILAMATAGASDIDPKLHTFGLWYSVYCADLPDSRYGPRTVRTAEPWPAAIIELIEPDLLTTCRDRIWPVAPAPAADHLPVRSNVPTLLAFGEFDSTSSRYDAEQGAIGLPNSRVLGIPWDAHIFVGSGRVDRECSFGIYAAFLGTRRPNLAVDTGCLARIPPARFTFDITGETP
jgi:pimeloyl-ACP methyl ester carboxylesterase